MSNTENYLWLASASPRRRELLEQIGVCFRQILPQIDEEKFTAGSSAELVTMLAIEKAAAARSMLAESELLNHPILAADTMVVRNDEALGKPANRDQAIAMLESLSGKTHQVMTAIAVCGLNEIHTEIIKTRVTFKVMNAEEIVRYCDTDEPFDKAGGYGIQGRAGAFITHIEGSYSAVVGLPLFETHELLHRVGFRI
ncbi:MAG: septum formation protein [Parasphingorhabdus sp.]|jgi:septum formation protein